MAGRCNHAPAETHDESLIPRSLVSSTAEATEKTSFTVRPGPGSRRAGIILDPFGGSGTTILAAERTGRVARVIELDPLYLDVTIRRWEQITGIQARHGESQTSFAELVAKRGTGRPAAPAPSRRTLSRSTRG
jgi:hypothetical protein